MPEPVRSASQVSQQLDRDQLAAQRRLGHLLQRLLVIGAVLSLASLGSYVLLYIQTGVWQILVALAGLAIGIACCVPAYRSVGQGKIQAAGYWGMSAPLIMYAVSELVMADATVHLLVSVTLMVALLASIIRPQRPLIWLAAVASYYVYVALVNHFEPLPRFPMLEISPFTQYLNIPLALLILWQIARAIMGVKIRYRIALSTAFLVLIPVIAISVVVILVDEQVAQQYTQNQLESVATLKASEIETWVESLKSDLVAALSSEDALLRARLVLNAGDQRDAQTYPSSSYQRLQAQFSSFSESTGRFEEILLANGEGLVVLSTEPATEGSSIADETFFRTGMDGEAYVQPPTHIAPWDDLSIVAVQPVYDERGAVRGVLAGREAAEELNDIMLERAGLGETGETYLVDARGHFVTEPRVPVPDEEMVAESAGITGALAERADGAGVYENYRGVPVIGHYTWLPELEVALLVEQEEAEAMNALVARRTATAAIALIATVIALFATIFITHSIAKPLIDLNETTLKIAAGDRELTAGAKRDDEIGTLASSINSMATQLRDLIDNLETRVEERTQELETVAELSRAVSRVRDVNRLLPYAVDLVQERTGYYHVQVFIVDPQRNDAILRASTGEVGRKLLDLGHSLPVGSDSVIGQVTARGEPVVALDTEGAQVVHRPNPLLPDTRSEMALPLRIEDRVIGALDVQSVEPNAFDENDVWVFRLLADQLAVAIENANLLQESGARLQEIDLLNRRLVGESWREHIHKRYKEALGAEASEQSVTPDAVLTPQMSEAVRARQPVVQPFNGGHIVALPVVYRDVTLGALEFEVEGDTVDPDTLSLAQALADRLALSMDNVRLTERSQRMAQRERIVNEISGKLTGKTDIAEILQTTVRELGQALHMPETTIQLVTLTDRDSDQLRRGER